MHTHTGKAQEKRDPRGAGWRTHALPPPPTHGNLHAIGALTHHGGAAARIMQCIVCCGTGGGRRLRCNVCILGHMAQHALAQVSVLGPCAATRKGVWGGRGQLLVPQGFLPATCIAPVQTSIQWLVQRCTHAGMREGCSTEGAPSRLQSARVLRHGCWCVSNGTVVVVLQLVSVPSRMEGRCAPEARERACISSHITYGQARGMRRTLRLHHRTQLPQPGRAQHILQPGQRCTGSGVVGSGLTCCGLRCSTPQLVQRAVLVGGA
jgi:hypothetical protein